MAGNALKRLGSFHRFGYTMSGVKCHEISSKYREMPEFCDIVVLVEGERFDAHKLVLSAASPVLYKLFTNGMKESGQAEVTLQDLKACVWHDVMKFVYGKPVTITDWESGFGLLECARRFQIEPLESSVSEYIVLGIKKDNCCLVLMCLDKLGSTALKEKAMQTLAENFHDLYCCPTLSVLDIDSMEEVVSSKRLRVRSEIDVALAIALWLARNGFVKMDDVAPLFPDTTLQTDSAMDVSPSHTSETIRQVKKRLSRHIEVTNVTTDELVLLGRICRIMNFDDIFESCVQRIFETSSGFHGRGDVHLRSRREFADDGIPHFNIQVRDSEGEVVQFKIKPLTPLKRLKDAYSLRMDVEPSFYRFLFDGRHVRDDDTAASLRMKDLDIIDAMAPQIC